MKESDIRFICRFWIILVLLKIMIIGLFIINNITVIIIVIVLLTFCMYFITFEVNL